MGKIMSDLGVKNSDHIIVYDNSDVLVHAESGLLLYTSVMIQILFLF